METFSCGISKGNREAIIAVDRSMRGAGKDLFRDGLKILDVVFKTSSHHLLLEMSFCCQPLVGYFHFPRI